MNFETILSELSFSFTRSGGPGGQHANKVSSKVMLVFDIRESSGLSETEMKKITTGLSSRINKKGQLILTCDETRSQSKNKQIVVARLRTLLDMKLKKQKRRVPVKIGKKERQRRLEAKKKRGLQKKLRQKPRFGD